LIDQEFGYRVKLFGLDLVSGSDFADLNSLAGAATVLSGFFK